MGRYVVAWSRAGRWVASVDGGSSYGALSSCDESDAAAAIDEASGKHGVPAEAWDLKDDEVQS